MKITVKKEVFQRFHPEFKVAFILAQNIDNKKRLKESLNLLQEVEDMIHLLFRKETVKTHHLISPWTTAQQEFGPKAKHYQTAVEKLLTKVLKKKKIKTSSTLTNLVNYLSLKHIVPLTVDDFNKIKGNLTFRLSTGKERISILKKLKKNALFYRDGKRVLGTKLDFWKSPHTKPDKKTTAFLIHIEALPPITSKKLNEVVKEAASLIENFCRGKTKSFILDKKKNSVKI